MRLKMKRGGHWCEWRIRYCRLAGWVGDRGSRRRSCLADSIRNHSTTQPLERCIGHYQKREVARQLFYQPSTEFWVVSMEAGRTIVRRAAIFWNRGIRDSGLYMMEGGIYNIWTWADELAERWKRGNEERFQTWLLPGILGYIQSQSGKLVLQPSTFVTRGMDSIARSHGYTLHVK